MTHRIAVMTIAAVLISGCASYSGAGLKPGIATVQDVESTMGQPAMAWKNDRGLITQLSYPRGPAGWVSFMVYFDDQGKMTRKEQVLDLKHFTEIKIGDTQEQVLKILGPYRDTYHFPQKKALDWNWGWCDQSLLRMAFTVTFDEDTLLVKTTEIWPDPFYQRGGMYSTYCEPWTGDGSFENP